VSRQASPPRNSPRHPADPRAIALWASRYARSRTISFLVQWVLVVFMVAVIGVAAGLTSSAYEQQNMGLFTLSVALMGVVFLVMAWFSLSQWGSDLVWTITLWWYGEEGYAEASGRQPIPGWLTALGGGLVAYHLVGAILVSFGLLRLQWLQPFSALYMTPYLCALILRQRLGWWAWIWPALYGLHALALLAGVPLRFPPPWRLLDLIVPVFGYGLLAILAGHVYSRYALRRLKQLTRAVAADLESPENTTVTDPEGSA